MPGAADPDRRPRRRSVVTRCHSCSRPVGLADQHLFDPVHVYCGRCCPACAAPHASTCDELVERAKRGHRRGTPRRWALRGAGG